MKRRIIGIDPGIGRTGFAVLEADQSKVVPIEYGCITTTVNGQIEARLHKLYTELSEIVKRHKPEVMILERVFFNHNQSTVIAVGQAQGVMLLVAAENKLEVDFITPLQIKASLTGYGHADKKQVQKMVTLLLNLKEVPKPDDTADAIACGLTYLTYQNLPKAL